jgi:LPS sulfotransferase NodH
MTGKRFYCICFSIRSGSSLLAEDLAQWGIGDPTEYFQLPDPALVDVHMPDYLVALAETARNDCFGFKISWDQTYELVNRIRRDGDESVGFDLRTVFPDLRYIHITRDDKVAQAISAWRAQSSGTWHWPVGTHVEPGRPQYEPEAIKFYLQQTLAEEWLWQSHFEEVGIEPLAVRYEDYVQDRPGHLNRIVDYLGLTRVAGPLEERLHIMRDDWTEQIADRFRADLYTVPDPLMVRSVAVSASNPADHAPIPEPAVPDPVPTEMRPSPVRTLPSLGAPVAVVVGVAAVAEAAVPQATLAPLLILAPLLASLLVSARGIAVVSLLAALAMLPVSVADHIAGNAAQIWIIGGIAVAALSALWIRARRVRFTH